MTDEERDRRIQAVNKVREDLKPFEEAYPHLKSFSEFLEDFNRETERGAALVAAAFVDDLLFQIISAFLRPTDDVFSLLVGLNAPLGTMHARTAAAHAMGLISDEERTECDIVRKVRNEFAHKVQMSFDDEKVRSLCMRMKYRAKPYGEITVSTRGAFSTASVALILNLTNRPHYVGKHQLTYIEWPAQSTRSPPSRG